MTFKDQDEISKSRRQKLDELINMPYVEPDGKEYINDFRSYEQTISFEIGLRKRAQEDRKLEQAKDEVSALMSGGYVGLPQEFTERVSGLAKDIKGHFNSQAEYLMSEGLANYVRVLRKSDFTWRSIAQEINDKLRGDWGSNQFMGIALCEAAADFLGEDANEEPWN